MRIRKLAPITILGALLLLNGFIYAMSADTQSKLVQLITGLDQKAAAMRTQHKTNPKLGLDKIAASLETRVKQLKNANYSEGSNLFGDAAAYVTVGNAISVTPNFFSARYNDAERQAILLHEAVHLEQGIWEKKLKFWGNRGEADAYKEEYKWLTVLGVGAGSKESKYEIFNVLQALNQDYGVIPGDDKTQSLDGELGLTPEQLVYFNSGPSTPPGAANLKPLSDKPLPTAVAPPDPAQTAASTPVKLLSYENKFFSFQIPSSGWQVSFGDAGSSQERYVFLIKEVGKDSVGDGAIVVTYGVRITLGEVLGADAFNPGVEKLRDNEMAQDQKWNFSPEGATRNFSKYGRPVAGCNGLGYVKSVTSKDGQLNKTLVTERLYFKSGRKYYFSELFYDTAYRAQISTDAGVFLNSLRVKAE